MISVRICRIMTVFVISFFAITTVMFSQVKVISTNLSAYNVSPESMCNVTILGNSSETSAILTAKIFGKSGKELVSVKSSPFITKNSVFNTSSQNIKIASVSYQDAAFSEYVHLYHQLPAGSYNYVVTIETSDGSSDDFTESLESESSSFISLVNPSDNDTIDNLNPLLLWNHSESFKLLQQGEYFRLLLTELRTNQQSDAAINANPPQLKLDFLVKHDVLYPYDAPILIPGKKYAWQVQKISNGLIVNKSEAWEFTVKPEKRVAPTRNFVEMSPGLNTTPYNVENGRVYFLFNNEYSVGTGDMKIYVSDHKGKETEVKAQLYYDEALGKEDRSNISLNRFELNLDDLNLKPGSYILKIRNIKNQEFILNFRYKL